MKWYSDMDLALQTVVNSVGTSLLYALMVIGFTLIYGVCRIPNMAHGVTYMMAAVMVWLMSSIYGLPFPLAALIGIGVAIGIGLTVEFCILRPLQKYYMLAFLASIGVIFFLEGFALSTWHAAHMMVFTPVRGGLEIFGTSIALYRLVLIAVTASVFGCLWFFLMRTRYGRALRAVSVDAEAASIQGISISRMRLIAIALGAGLAELAGVLVSPIQVPSPFMGGEALGIAFMATIVGGVGSIQGALLAAFIYGFLITFVTTYVDGTTAFIAGGLLMFLILVVKPRGLWGYG